MPISTDVRLSYLKWRVSEELDDARSVLNRRLYYAGEHPTYLTERQKDFINLNQRGRKYSDNYCKDVVDILAERLSLNSVTTEGDDQAAAQVAWNWWTANKFDSKQDELYIAALRDGETYIIVDFDNGQERPRWSMGLLAAGESEHHTYGVRLHRDPDTDEPVFASKRWQSWDKENPGKNVREMKALYFPDRVEIYTTPDRLAGREWRDAGWMPFIETDPETGQQLPWPIWWTEDGTETGAPLGLPVIPFTNPGGSEISTSIISLQDALNKSEIDLIAAADMAGFPVAYVIGVDPEEKITFSPARLIQILNKDAQVGRLEAAQLTSLLDACAYFQHAIGSRARIPLYLLQKWGATPPTGESLKVQESGVIAKTQRKQTDFGESWRQVLQMSAKLDRVFGQNQIPEDVEFLLHWKTAYLRTIEEQSAEAEAKKKFGVPDEHLLVEVFGYTPLEARQFVESRDTRSNQVIGETVMSIFGAQNVDNTRGLNTTNGATVESQGASG